MEEILYELNKELFEVMFKYEEIIGDDNEYVRLVSKCLDIIAEQNNIDEKQHEKIIDKALKFVIGKYKKF